MIALGILLAFIIFIVVEALYIAYNGQPVGRPNVARQEQTFGQGPALRYAILGDSTTISQGGDYKRGYAVASANFLAKDHRVTWRNFGISGARARDVADKQLQQALLFNPDVVLIAVGANDVTHLTATNKVTTALQRTIADLQHQNPNVRILLTGSPDMGSVPRFPWPVNYIADRKTKSINKAVAKLADTNHQTFVPIARETGPTFRAHPELFAADKFHPTNDGYKLWIPVINQALRTSGAGDARVGP